MKIGIMTFWESRNNYGQLLQIYALQKVLREMHYNPYLIRFIRKRKKGYINRIKYIVRIYLKNIRYIFRIIDAERNDFRKFDSFRSKYLTMSDRIYESLYQLQEYPPEGDAYICGSDQVWNSSMKGSCEPFLLNFGSDKTLRISYAASFGVKRLDNETTPMFKNLLKRFTSISVRETSGLTICKDIGFVEAVFVPDPTLLISKESWRKLSDPNYDPYPANGRKNIFIYIVGGKKKVVDKNLFIRYANESGNVVHVSSNKDYSGPDVLTIQQWLKAVYMSDFVITNSFHCTAFCILFNKNFVVLPRTGENIEMNERISSILSFFNLEDHMITSFNINKMEEQINKKIDWKNINDKIDSWKQKGIEFLLRSLNEKISERYR